MQKLWPSASSFLHHTLTLSLRPVVSSWVFILIYKFFLRMRKNIFKKLNEAVLVGMLGVRQLYLTIESGFTTHIFSSGRSTQRVWKAHKEHAPLIYWRLRLMTNKSYTFPLHNVLYLNGGYILTMEDWLARSESGADPAMFSMALGSPASARLSRSGAIRTGADRKITWFKTASLKTYEISNTSVFHFLLNKEK